MNNKLKTIKIRFDAAIDHLDYFYPLFNSILNKSIDGNYSLYEVCVKELNNRLKYYFSSDYYISKTILDATLYLDETELYRFYIFAKDAISIKKNTLDLILQNVTKIVKMEENVMLEYVFFQNFNIGIVSFPTKRSYSNFNFLNDLIRGTKDYFNDFEKSIDKITKVLPPQQTETKTDKLKVELGNPKIFSAFEWATIFYYVDASKQLPDSPTIKKRMEHFMSKHKIETTFENFKSKYYKAANRLYKTLDYPTYKLELILPFIKENYPRVVTKVEEDKKYLEDQETED